MKLDPGMHIVMHLVFFGKTGVTQGCLYIMLHMPCHMQEMHKESYTYATKELPHTNSRNQANTKLPSQTGESYLI
jgi:hypothetical protein